MPKPNRTGLGQGALIGFTVSASGGPVALGSIYLIQSARVPEDLRGPLTAAGALLFLAPLAIWLRYSRRLASSGGLYSFVREAAGRPIALVHGLLWSFSYLLYLAFTAAYVVYFLLPEILPVSPQLQAALELSLPLVLTAGVVASGRGTVRLLAAFGAVQVVIVAVFAVLAAAGRPSAAPTQVPWFTFGRAGRAGGALSLLFVCSSLVLYLGGEARRGRRGIRRSLLWGYGAVALLSVSVSFALAPWIDTQAAASAIPGYSIVLRAAGPQAALWVGLATLLSLVGLILAEFIALGRLWRTMFSWNERQAGVVIGILFLLLDGTSLANPFRFYNLTIGPSLAALFVSQLIAFVVYPLFQHRLARFRLLDGVATIIAIGWSLFGVYLALTPAPAY